MRIRLWISFQEKAHLTRPHQHPHPIPDKPDPHSADSSPNPHLVPGPDPQVGHYNNHLHYRYNMCQQWPHLNKLKSFFANEKWKIVSHKQYFVPKDNPKRAAYLWPSAPGRDASIENQSWPVLTRSCTLDYSGTDLQGPSNGRAVGWFL